MSTLDAVGNDDAVCAAIVAVQEVHDPLDGLAKGPTLKLLNGGQS
jgi:hypothetical protein